jgi:hypothetical protein
MGEQDPQSVCLGFHNNPLQFDWSAGRTIRVVHELSLGKAFQRTGIRFIGVACVGATVANQHEIIPTRWRASNLTCVGVGVGVNNMFKM